MQKTGANTLGHNFYSIMDRRESFDGERQKISPAGVDLQLAGMLLSLLLKMTLQINSKMRHVDRQLTGVLLSFVHGRRGMLELEGARRGRSVPREGAERPRLSGDEATCPGRATWRTASLQ